MAQTSKICFIWFLNNIQSTCFYQHGLTHCLLAGIGLGVKGKLGCLKSFMKGTIWKVFSLEKSEMTQCCLHSSFRIGNWNEGRRRSRQKFIFPFSRFFWKFSRSKTFTSEDIGMDWRITFIFTSLFFCILWHLGWLHSAGGCVWGRWWCVQASQTSAATRTPARTASICRNLLWSSPPDVFKVHNCGRLCAPVRQVFSCLPPPTAPAAPGHQKIAHLNPQVDAFLCEGEIGGIQT